MEIKYQSYLFSYICSLIKKQKVTSQMIKITFPDGNIREYEAGVSPMQIAESISMGLAKKVLVAEVNGKVLDLTRTLAEDSSLKLFTWDDKEGKETYWHSSAHLMAEALEALYPNVKLNNSLCILV